MIEKRIDDILLSDIQEMQKQILFALEVEIYRSFGESRRFGYLLEGARLIAFRNDDTKRGLGKPIDAFFA